MMILLITSRAEAALLEECGLTESDLQAVLMAHQDNRQVQEVFLGMQVGSSRLWLVVVVVVVVCVTLTWLW